MINQLDKLIKEYNSLQPFNEDCKKKLDKKFRLEFNYNSNHLEGNTLTYGETKLLLIFDQIKGNHEFREFEEMKAHDVALLMIREEAADKDKPLTEKFIKDLNQTILVRPFWKDAITPEGQSARRQIKVGEYKEYPNSVIQSNGEIFEYASPQETPIKMAELVKWYNDEEQKKELTPIELAALLHHRYILIHPFDDGNGRVSRLLVNYVLYKNNLPPVIIKTSDKKNYLRALQQADTGDLQAFINYMIQQLAWSIDLCIKAAKGESIEEQDDWQKQLALLKKGLGDKSDKVIKMSRNLMINFFDETIKSMFSLYEEKISLFDSLFMSRKTSLLWNDIYEIKGNNLNELLEELKSKSAAGKIAIHDKLGTFLTYLNIQNTKNISLKSYFEDLRKPLITAKIESIELKIHINENAYAFEYKDDYVTKLYSDSFNKEEINAIISEIGADLVKQIQSITEA